MMEIFNTLEEVIRSNLQHYADSSYLFEFPEGDIMDRNSAALSSLKNLRPVFEKLGELVTTLSPDRAVILDILRGAATELGSSEPEIGAAAEEVPAKQMRAIADLTEALMIAFPLNPGAAK